MSRTQNTKRPGFTLLELLVVMAILIALMALIVPAMMSRQEKSRINQVKIKVGQLENDLELYSTENRGYPTTEQGLMALIYIPDNAGLGRTTLSQQVGGGQMGTPGMDGTGGAFGMGEATMTGGDTTMMPMPGVDGGMTTMPGTPTGMPNTGVPGGVDMTGMTDPTLGGGGFGMTDPMNPGAAIGGTMGGWTQPEYNPAIYTQLRKRPQPYVEKETDLTDPWGMPYRYENNLQFNGLNRTGTAKPAIWSAGPDKIDYTDDDICNWDPIEAQQNIAARQQQLQGTGGTMMNPDGTMMNNNMMQPDGMGNMMQPDGMMNQPPMTQPMPPMNQPPMTQPMPPVNQPPMAQPPMTQPPMTQPMPPAPTP